MLSLRNISFWYDCSQPPAVYRFSMDLPPGVLISIVGESGSGKSTILKAATGLLQAEMRRRPELGYQLEGEVLLDGKEVTGPNAHFGYVPQAFQSSLVAAHSARKNIELAISAVPDKRHIRNEAEHMMALLGISDIADSSVRAISGGQMQRVAIARALITRPMVLFMDEPYANLDPVLRPQIAEMLNRVQDDRGLSILMVTHDVESAVHVSDHVIGTRSSYGPPEYRLWPDAPANEGDLRKAIEGWMAE